MLSGGFPCQDISLGGKGAGLAGERSGLWREMVRSIRLVRPGTAVVENVAALLDRGMGQVLGDLAESGYDAEWDCLPAAAFGAFHFRDRVFIVASQSSNTDCLRSQGLRALETGAWPEQQFEGLLQDSLSLSVPTGKSGGISDGLPDRSHRLKGIGNAVVPQIAEWIGRQIVDATHKETKAD